MEKTAKLLGITSEVPESKTLSVRSRVKLAMEMFE